MKNKRNDMIAIIAQAFYGNRTGTKVRVDELDRFILGYLDGHITVSEPIDRTIIQIPGTDNVVLIYNKHQETERLEDKQRYYEEDGYVLKPLAAIPELGLEIYSRCIACRMDKEGKLQSLQPEDYEMLMQYLAE